MRIKQCDRNRRRLPVGQDFNQRSFLQVFCYNIFSKLRQSEPFEAHFYIESRLVDGCLPPDGYGQRFFSFYKTHFVCTPALSGKIMNSPVMR
ncbi:Uncharacterised protein [Klebsiella pneumoniae]|nr:Uncharacterised protein [Klebsiella pneumoniae]